jgi:hypothetical protein
MHLPLLLHNVWSTVRSRSPHVVTT